MYPFFFDLTLLCYVPDTDSQAEGESWQEKNRERIADKNDFAYDANILECLNLMLCPPKKGGDGKGL